MYEAVGWLPPPDTCACSVAVPALDAVKTPLLMVAPVPPAFVTVHVIVLLVAFDGYCFVGGV